MDENQAQQAEANAQPADDSLLTPADAPEQEAKPAEQPESNDAGDEAKPSSDDQASQYAFSMPEGYEINQDMLALANPVFAELGLSQEQAQKLVDVYVNSIQKQVESTQQNAAQMQETVRKDPELGGDKFDSSIALANKAAKAYFEPGFIEVLKDYGLGNHPEIIRGLKRVAERHLTEDIPGGGKPPAQERSRIERLYGTN